jgi:hypothetical protein
VALNLFQYSSYQQRLLLPLQPRVVKEAIAEEVAEEGVTEEAAAERGGTKVGYTRAMPECEEGLGYPR